jgi:hypothetical protein
MPEEVDVVHEVADVAPGCSALGVHTQLHTAGIGCNTINRTQETTNMLRKNAAKRTPISTSQYIAAIQSKRTSFVEPGVGIYADLQMQPQSDKKSTRMENARKNCRLKAEMGSVFTRLPAYLLMCTGSMNGLRKRRRLGMPIVRANDRKAADFDRFPGGLDWDFRVLLGKAAEGEEETGMLEKARRGPSTH